ncbi:hypothetical protein D3C77_547040 [compost metagenome]
MKNIVFSATLFCALSACSTSPVSVSDARPSSKVYAFQINPSGPYGSLTIVRDSGFVSSGCDMGIYINGQLAARLATKERATFKIPAGEVVVGAGVIGSGLCSTAAQRREREVNISAGQSKRYRVFTSSEADVDLLPSTL